jgi:methyl-accepting chemotaxis protein
MASIRTQLIGLWVVGVSLVAMLSFLAVGVAPPEDAAAASRRLLGIAGGLAVVVVGLAASLWWFDRRLREAFGGVTRAVRQLAEGDMSARLESRAFAETAALAEEFDGAVQRLQGLLGAVCAASRQMDRAAAEMAQGHADLSRRTEHQASSLQQTASAVQQMTATVTHNAQSAQRASEHATAATDVASRGGQAVAMVIGTMEAISDSSKRIADIIGVIDEIAFQTNLLALNAAVEAARAGAQGRGFAVVATEVRSLAQRSADASKEIRQLILGSSAQVGEGAAQVEHAGETMAEIVDAVKRVTGLIAEISAASQEQSQSLHQASDTLQQLEKVTQQNAALVEQANGVSASIEEQAAALAHAVAAFRLPERAEAFAPRPVAPFRRESAALAAPVELPQP